MCCAKMCVDWAIVHRHGLTSRLGPKSVRTVKQATQWQKLIFFMEAKVISIELIIAISPRHMIKLVFAYLLT